MSIDTQSQQVAAVAAQPKHLNPLQEQVRKLTEQVDGLSAQIGRDQQQKSKPWYKCGQTGHVQRDCFYQQQFTCLCFLCNKPGHIAK